MLKEFLPDLHARSRLWSLPESKQALYGFFRLIPAVALWYFWCVQSLNPYFDDAGVDPWQKYWPVHVLFGLIITTGLLLIARLSPRARKTQPFGAFAVGLFVCGMAVIVLPINMGLLGLIPIALATVWYWLTPWRVIRARWHNYLVSLEFVMAMSMSIIKKLLQLPYTNLRHPFSDLLQDFIEVSKALGKRVGDKNLTMDDYGLIFSQHCLPILAAFSYRQNISDNTNDPILKFIELYPGKLPAYRSDLNTPQVYANLANEADTDRKPMWLKAGLIVADKKSNTSASALYDLELMLLQCNVSDTIDKKLDETEHLLVRIMKRLNDTQPQYEGDNLRPDRLNLYQRLWWVGVLQAAVELPDEYVSIRQKIAKMDQVWPGHRSSFDKDAFGYSEELEQKFYALIDVLKADGLNKEDSATEQSEMSAADVADLYLSARGAFLDVLNKNLPFSLVVELSFFLEEKQRADIRRHYHQNTENNPDISNSKTISESSETEMVIVAQFRRYLDAVKREYTNKIRQFDEYQATNYTPDTERLENELENAMNHAAMERFDVTVSTIDDCLTLLRNKYEEAPSTYQHFVNHIGYKFGALIHSVNECFSNDNFAWLLQTAENDRSIIEETGWETQFLLRGMFNNMCFHRAMSQHDTVTALQAIEQQLVLMLVRFPVNANTIYALIVSGLEIIHTANFTEEIADLFLTHISNFEKDLYPLVTPEEEADLRNIVHQAYERYPIQIKSEVH